MPKEATAFRTVVTAGAISGSLDISAAFIRAGLSGISPARVLRFIASGLLGPQAFTGGAAAAACGALAHFTIAFTASLVFYLASRRLSFLADRPIISGALYGIAVWAVMNMVVVPLSAVPHRGQSAEDVIIGAVILIFCIGLPNSFIVRWSAKSQAHPIPLALPKQEPSALR